MKRAKLIRASKRNCYFKITLLVQNKCTYLGWWQFSDSKCVISTGRRTTPLTDKSTGRIIRLCTNAALDGPNSTGRPVVCIVSVISTFTLAHCRQNDFFWFLETGQLGLRGALLADLDADVITQCRVHGACVVARDMFLMRGW